MIETGCDMGNRVTAYIVLLTELLAQRSTHDNAALAGGSIEVRLARLAARRGDCCGINMSVTLFLTLTTPS